MTIYKASLSLISLLRKAKAIGGKYLKRWQVSNPKTGKMKWVYKYKPISQRGAHEVTGKTFEKKTGLGKEEHKSAVEKALQSGNRVSLHILRDYPDLVQKYGMSKRLERADKINAKVREIREKNKASEKNANEPVSAADNNSNGEQKNMNALSNDPKTLYTEVRKMYTSLNPFDFVESAKPYLDKIESIGAANFGNFNYRGTIVSEIERVEKLKSAGITKKDLELPSLPSLQGSEKQIPWANQIRKEKLQQFYNTILRNSYSPLRGFNKEKADKIKEKVQNNSAKFWIDNRNTSIDSIIN